MLSPFFHDDWLVTWPEKTLSRHKKGETNDFMKPLQPIMNLDLVEHDAEFSVHADLPGVNKEDIDIKIDNGLLTISAKKENKHEQKTSTVHHMERSFGTVQRSIRLPKKVVAADVCASFNNGVLEVTLPKQPNESPTAMKVPIGSNQNENQNQNQNW